MRIFLATLLTFFVTGILILTTRIWGLGQQFAEFNNPFFEGQTPQLILKADTVAKAFAAIQLKRDVVIWLDVRLSVGNVPFILPSARDIEFLKSKTDQQKLNPTQKVLLGGKLSDYPWDQIKDFYSGAPTLKDFYSSFPDTRFILNIIDNVSDVDTVIVDTIKALHPDKRTFIQSDGLVLIKAIKDLKPEWVYGTSVPDLMRFLSFDSMLVLPATQFKGDVFVAPFVIMKRKAFNDEIIAEMRRRHKRIYLGPIANAQQLQEANNIKAEGLITEDLQQLLELIAEGQK